MDRLPVLVGLDDFDRLTAKRAQWDLWGGRQRGLRVPVIKAIALISHPARKVSRAANSPIKPGSGSRKFTALSMTSTVPALCLLRRSQGTADFPVETEGIDEPLHSPAMSLGDRGNFGGTSREGASEERVGISDGENDADRIAA